MVKTGQTVTLTVAKQGAVFHRLATLLAQPTPPQQRANQRPGLPYQTRPKSDGYALSQAQDPNWQAGENPQPAKSTQNINYNENNSRTKTSYNQRDRALHQSSPRLSMCFYVIFIIYFSFT